MPKLRDLKFVEAYKVPHWEHLINRTYEKPLCTRVASVYSANLMRMHLLTRLPGVPFRFGKIYRHAQFEVNHQQHQRGSEFTQREYQRRAWDEFFRLTLEEEPKYAVQHDLDSTESLSKLGRRTKY